MSAPLKPGFQSPQNTDWQRLLPILYRYQTTRRWKKKTYSKSTWNYREINLAEQDKSNTKKNWHLQFQLTSFILAIFPFCLEPSLDLVPLISDVELPAVLRTVDGVSSFRCVSCVLIKLDVLGCFFNATTGLTVVSGRRSVVSLELNPFSYNWYSWRNLSRGTTYTRDSIETCDDYIETRDDAVILPASLFQILNEHLFKATNKTLELKKSKLLSF